MTGVYIPAAFRGNLRKYKYAGTDKSLVSRYILQPYWNTIINYVPMWMAPNLVTLTGFMFIVVNVIVTLALSENLTVPLPSWCYYMFGVFLFLYQSLDAIDGKQARRTGQSGPLGELFDHGCDALNSTLTVICVSSALDIGHSYWHLVSLVCTLGNFYLSTWEEYHTGVLALSYFSGPVEGILGVVAMFLATGLYGPRFWHQATPLLAIPLYQTFIYLSIAIIAFNIITSLINVVHVKRAGAIRALGGLVPFIGTSALVAAWAIMWPALVESHAVPLSLYVTFLFGLLVGRIIVAHVVKAPFPFTNVAMVPLIVIVANLAVEKVAGIRAIPADMDVTVLWVAVAWSALAYAHFAKDVIGDICAELDIWCLVIKHPLHKKKA
ncbi:hypothetical protein GGF31_006381 [Allomyces arbusculus]|nr:hypothetical protein GGF31_006381 [Allomyces arbusculus]